MKLVINACYGGFSLSKKAYEFLGLNWDGYGFIYRNFKDRTRPDLVECVEKLGESASGAYSDLKVIEIPRKSLRYLELDEYYGVEYVYDRRYMWE